MLAVACECRAGLLAMEQVHRVTHARLAKEPHRSEPRTQSHRIMRGPVQPRESVPSCGILAVHFVRKLIARALRSRAQFIQVNALPNVKEV